MAIHEEQIQAFGGALGLRSAGLLESAVAVVQAGFDGTWLHRDTFEMAAGYAFHIAENQPFVDGNKRAALASALTFLLVNGVDVDDPRERLYDAMIALSSRQLDKFGLAALLRELASPIDR